MMTHKGSRLVRVGKRRLRQELKRIAMPKSRLAGMYEARKPPGTWVTT